MSNFSAPTRKKGSNDEYKEAVWVDNYFGPKKYGVRFRGTIEFLNGDDYEIKEAIAE